MIPVVMFVGTRKGHFICDRCNYLLSHGVRPSIEGVLCFSFWLSLTGSDKNTGCSSLVYKHPHYHGARSFDTPNKLISALIFGCIGNALLVYGRIGLVSITGRMRLVSQPKSLKPMRSFHFYVHDIIDRHSLDATP
jgi:hypothetical protein